MAPDITGIGLVWKRLDSRWTWKAQAGAQAPERASAQFYVASVTARDVARNGQPEAHALLIARARLIEA
jgi:hypothetical protein